MSRLTIDCFCTMKVYLLFFYVMFIKKKKRILRCLMDFSIDSFHQKGIRSFTHFIQQTSAVTFLTSFSSFIKMYAVNPVFQPVVRPRLWLNIVSQEFSSDYILSYNIYFIFQQSQPVCMGIKVRKQKSRKNELSKEKVSRVWVRVGVWLS